MALGEGMRNRSMLGLLQLWSSAMFAREPEGSDSPFW
jgi:hypothetical protein